MDQKGACGEWIYVTINGWLVTRFRVRFEPLSCCHYCLARPCDHVESMAPESVFMSRMCVSCYQVALDMNKAVFLTPEEGQPYFEGRHV